MTQILVIDDEAIVRKTIRMALEGQGYEIFEAGNGIDGLKLAASKSPKLAIIDILMPDKDGLETILELKRTSPELKFLVMSGGGRTRNTEFLAIAVKLGADDFMKKPFDISTLREKVEALCA